MSTTTSITKLLLKQKENQSFLCLFTGTFVVPISSYFFAPSLWSYIRSPYLVWIYISLVVVLSRMIARGAVCEIKKDLRGKHVLITGGAAGLGQGVAIEFAKMGAKVTIGCRGIEQGKMAVKQIIKAAGLTSDSDRIRSIQLDLASFQSIRTFAEDYIRIVGECDLLVNNAGIWPQTYSQTDDKLESCIGVNHFGHFLLTLSLMPILIKSQTRIINVSSHCHHFCEKGFDYDFVNNPQNKYNGMVTYGMSKLAQIYFTQELHNRYGAQGIQAYALHPGMVNTGIARHLPTLPRLMVTLLGYIVAKTCKEGAQTVLHCALSPSVVSGQFYDDCAPCPVSEHAVDKSAANSVWLLSEKLCGIRAQH